jgi:hypothetical protein
VSAPAARVCPACGACAIRRSRRQGLIDAVCSLWARFPYRCRDCNARFRLRPRTRGLGAGKPRLHQTVRAENRRRRRAVQRRELLLYGLALAAFAFVVLLVTGDRS